MPDIGDLDTVEIVLVIAAVLAVVLLMIGVALMLMQRRRSRYDPVDMPAVAPLDEPTSPDVLAWQRRVIALERRVDEQAATLGKVAAWQDRVSRGTEQGAPREIHDRRPEPGRAAPERASEMRYPAQDVLMADYRAAVDDLSNAGERFIQTHRPAGLVASEQTGVYVWEGDAHDAHLWGVRSGDHVLLMPGYQALRNWSSHYSPQRERTATTQFGDAFELSAESTRFDVAPATAEAQGARVNLRRRGRITGFRS